MTCHKIGWCPIGTIGFGMLSEYSRIRVPNPPQNKTTFMTRVLADLSLSDPRNDRLERAARWSSVHPTYRERRRCARCGLGQRPKVFQRPITSQRWIALVDFAGQLCHRF